MERRRLPAPPGRISGLIYAKGGKILVSVNSDATALVWDVTGAASRGKPPPQRIGDQELHALWNDLGSTDAAEAYRAMWRLAESAPQVVPFLRARLSPVAVADPKRTAALIKDLGSEQFKVRSQATRELEQLGDAAQTALRATAAADLPLEVRRRVDQLLQALAPPISRPERLRALRAVELLEYLATPQARQMLQALANGLPDALLTREAQASLRRLGRGAGTE
jgi:hypothetical protein